MAYDWPGNLRELQNIARTYVVTGDDEEIIAELSSRSRVSPIFCASRATKSVRSRNRCKGASQKLESEIILRTLERHRWNRRRAAQTLKISYRSLLYKMKSCNLRIEPQTTTGGKSEIHDANQSSRGPPRYRRYWADCCRALPDSGPVWLRSRLGAGDQPARKPARRISAVQCHRFRRLAVGIRPAGRGYLLPSSSGLGADESYGGAAGVGWSSPKERPACRIATRRATWAASDHSELECPQPLPNVERKPPAQSKVERWAFPAHRFQLVRSVVVRPDAFRKPGGVPRNF